MNIHSPLKTLVTGGAGFVGSHLCRRLLADGHEVICLDNLFTGTKDNIRDLLPNPRFEFLRHDVTFPLYLEVDRIYNLACPASPVHYQHDPVQTTKTSVHGAINMLGLAKRTGARILQASTSEVYGDPEVHPQPEGYWGRVNPIGIRSCYDEGKRCAETLFFDYHRQHRLDIRVVRIFNTYGPRMRLSDGRVVPNLVAQALKGAPHALLMGSDLLDAQFEDLETAAGWLAQDADVVLGPVADGGYWLLGLNHPQPALLAEMRWSTPSVMQDTRQRCQSLGLRWRELPLRHGHRIQLCREHR
jgi:nucleoside-diphosphate-sugar epimerase